MSQAPNPRCHTLPLDTLNFETRALHADGHNKPLHSHNQPIFQTSTFLFDSPEHGARLFAGKEKGHIYTRIGNPTVEAFESVIACLEEGFGAIAFGSGMAAVHAATLSFLQGGDHIVVGDTLYGPSTHLLVDVYAKWGIASTVVDPANLAAVQEALTQHPNTKLVYLESPANPTNKLSDIRAIAEMSHRAGAITVVDNTFMTPVFQQPLKLGADVVLHSLTKYLNGHGDVVGGVVVCKTAEHAQRVRNFRKDTGGILAPFDSWLVLRGLRTLKVRMEQLNKNGLVVAQFLHSHPKISKVMHPGLPDFPGHELALRQMKGFGSTFSFLMKDGYEAAKGLLERVHICSVGVSLGGVDTLIEHPASMTHASVPEALMAKQGLTRNLVRISVGLEDPADIIADLKQALDQL